MSTERELAILIRVKDEATAALNKLGGSFDDAQKASKYFAVGLAAAGVAAVGFGVLAVKAAADAQAELAKFDTVLKNSNNATAELRTKMLEAAAATRKLGFDDEETALSIARFYQRTGDLTQALNLNGIAMDLARDKNMSLTQAQTLVGLVLSGNGRALKQYGIDLKDSATPMEAVIELQDKLKGSAENFSKTYQGQMQIMNTQFTELKEIVGMKLLPVLIQLLQTCVIPLIEKSMVLAANIQNLTKYFSEHKAIIFMVAGGIVGALIPAFIGMATTLITVTIPAFAALAISLAPFILGGAIIGGIVAGIVWLVQNWGIVKEKFNIIWEGIKAIFGSGATYIKTKIDAMTGWFDNLIARIKDAIEWVGKFTLNNIGNAWANLPANLGFGGGKAIGGPVSAGTSYLVGERGPEMFVPSSSGRIIPNGGGQIVINISGNNINGAGGIKELADTIGKHLVDTLSLNNQLIY